MPNSIYYIIGTLFNAAIPFLFLPILTRVLSVEEYGALNLLITIYSLAVPIMSIALPQYVFRVYFDGKKLFKEKVESAVYTVLYWACILFFISLLCVLSLYSFELISKYQAGSILVIFISAVLNIFFQMRIMLFNAEGKARHYIAYQFSYTVVIFFFTLASLFLVNSGSFSRVIGTIFADLVFAIISIRLLRKCFNINIFRSNKIDTEFLKFGFGLIPHLIASILLSSADKIIIASKLSMADLASYALSVQFCAILMIYTQGISKEWSRYYLSHRSSVKTLKIAFLLSSSIFIVALVIYSLKDLFFVIFVGEGYVISSAVILILLLSQVFHSIYMIISVEITYQKKTHILSSMTVLSLVVNIIVSMILVGTYKSVGVAIGTMAGMFAKLLAVSLFFNYSKNEFK
ncbi:oligosaccharide flippase family protein [Vibrio fluvialis]|nr:oligosaccharide flippase family protein [Vibrio fluvialis]